MRSTFNLLFAVALVCGPKAVFAHDAQAQSFCEMRLMLQEETTQKLGYVPIFKTEALKPFSKTDGAQRSMITAKHPRFGMTLAFIDFTIYENGKTIEIDKTDVLNENNFSKGLSNVLFAEMMAQNPGAQKLFGTLSDVNQRALNSALEDANGDCVEAFRQTPFYKMVAHYGVGNVTLECNPSTREYNFTVELEPPH